MAQHILTTIILLGLCFISPSNPKVLPSKSEGKSHSELKSKINPPDTWTTNGGDETWSGAAK